MRKSAEKISGGEINGRRVLALIIILFFVFFSASAILVSAQTRDYVPLSPLPGTEIEAGGKAVNLASYVQGMFKLLIGLAAVLAVVMIVIGGVIYVSTDAITGKSDAKVVIFRAIFGLLLTIAAWAFIYGINPALLRFDILETTPKIPAIPGIFTKVVTVSSDGKIKPGPPTAPGWYLKSEFLCEGYGQTTQFFGTTTEEVCKANINLSAPQTCLLAPIPPSTTPPKLTLIGRTCVLLIDN